MTTAPPAAPRSRPVPAAEGAETRSAILDATIALMRDEGYAAVSSRRIAARAGLKSKLVHYYFRNMDELFLAVYKRIEDEHFAAVTRALASRTPLRALWQLNLDATNTRMVLELTALANHRKALRAEIARASERFRLLQAAVFERATAGLPEGAGMPPPIVAAVVALAVSRLLGMDQVMGVDSGHAETLQWVEAAIAAIEGPAAPLTGGPD